MPRVIRFEIPAENPERAAKFYREVFGWEIQKWAGPMDYWLAKTGAEGQPGINGGLMRREGPCTGPTNTIDVASVDAAVQTVQTKGGKLVIPKMAIPGIGYLAYCHDTEGNLFGMLQPDAGAK